MINTVKKLRGLFPSGLYLGGSHALKRFFYNSECIVPGDLDLFYYGDRPMESWALELSLQSLGFQIIRRGINYDGKYKIPGQYAYYRLFSPIDVLEFDLIFVRKNCMAESIGSTLAGVQYAVQYSEDVFRKPNDPIIKLCMDQILNTNHVQLFRSKNTETQIEKVRTRCKNLGLHLTELP